jgi:hypothetical protein
MLFLFHAGNLGNLVLVKLLKKAVNGAYQVWILLKNDAKIKNCFQLFFKLRYRYFKIKKIVHMDF